MQTQSKVFIGIGIIIFIIIGFSLTKENDKANLANHDSSMMEDGEMMDDKKMMEDGEMMDEGEMEEMMDDDDSKMMNDDSMMDDKKMMEDGEMMDDDAAMMNDDDKMKDELTTAPAAPLAAGVYTTYTPAAVASSDAEFIVLNFSATWCPSCRTVDKDINANISSIPAGVEIYKVDYDTNVELRKKYGVTTQHTFVLVQSDGTMIKKWSGGNSLKDVLSNF